jgi:hypothetical protein
MKQIYGENTDRRIDFYELRPNESEIVPLLTFTGPSLINGQRMENNIILVLSMVINLILISYKDFEKNFLFRSRSSAYKFDVLNFLLVYKIVILMRMIMTISLILLIISIDCLSI